MDARTVIIGAGIVGSALAMHLAEGGDDGVLVIDPDLQGDLSSSERNAGGVRATWWQPENIQLCAETIDHLGGNAEHVGLRPDGYLWLHTKDTWPGACRAQRFQNDLGLGVQLVAPGAIADACPALHIDDAVVGATRSPHDGLVNPDAVRGLYRARARDAGARFADRTRLHAARQGTDGTWDLVCDQIPDKDVAHRVLRSDEIAARPACARITLRAARVVNAAGPWAGTVARSLGYRSPAHPAPRELSVFRSPVSLEGQGMWVLDSGCYVHHESGDLHLAGWSPADDTPRVSFAHEGAAFFEREIWPRLAARIPEMEHLEYARGWTGLYDLSPDRSAICGPVGPDAGFAGTELYEIHSFSGRGVMQGWAMSRLLAEEILTGRTDPRRARFAGRRFARGGWTLPEALHI